LERNENQWFPRLWEQWSKSGISKGKPEKEEVAGDLTLK
jgi:hypothetical protein